MEIVEGNNWIQRYIIQRELEYRMPQPTKSSGGRETPDPLARVKRSYFQKYIAESGTPEIAPDSSPLHSLVDSRISHLVDQAASEAEGFYTSNRRSLAVLPSYLQSDSEQYLTEVAAALSRNCEKMVELAVKSLPKSDPLMRFKLGRLIRRVLPSAEDRAIRQIASQNMREVGEISKRFRNSLIAKYFS